jgi:retron-type reverse transcriptase
LEKTFDKVNHNRLINELEKNISDPKLINEINKMLNTQILKRKLSDCSLNVGIHKNNILSPFLFNVYMSPLDMYIDELKTQYAKKHEFIPNPEFYKLQKQN